MKKQIQLILSSVLLLGISCTDKASKTDGVTEPTKAVVTEVQTTPKSNTTAVDSKVNAVAVAKKQPVTAIATGTTTLTKIDELKTEELEKIVKEIAEKSKKFAAQHPTILMTSSDKKIGIDDLKKAIVEIM